MQIGALIEKRCKMVALISLPPNTQIEERKKLPFYAFQTIYYLEKKDAKLCIWLPYLLNIKITYSKK